MFSLLLPALVLLIGSALLVAVPAASGQATRRLQWTAAAAVSLALLLLAVGAGTEAEAVARPSWSVVVPPLALRTNEPGRLLGMALLVTTLAAVLTVGPGGETDSAPGRARRRSVSALGRRDWALLLAMVAAGLITLLPGNLLTLALAWTALDGACAAAALLRPSSAEERRHALLSWGTGAVATFFLWGVALALQPGYSLQRVPPSSSPEGLWIALVLAVLLRLAPFPFHLHRSWTYSVRSRNHWASTGGEPEPVVSGAAGAAGANEQRPGIFGWQVVTATIQAATGIWLLAHSLGLEAMPFRWRQVVTTVLLTGIAVSGLLAWLSGDDREAMRWVWTGQAGTVALAALWAGWETALAEGIVLILAGGLLVLFSSLETVSIENRVAGAAGMAAIAGLPFTWGHGGRLLLYRSWLSDGWGLYVFLAAAAYLLFLAAAGKLLFRPTAASSTRVGRVAAGVGLGVPALGLLLQGGPPDLGGGLVWLAILIPLGGGALAAWRVESLRPFQKELVPWLQPWLTLSWLQRLIGTGATHVGQAIRAVHKVLEGEGALFWAMVMLMLGWLLVRSR